ncbi:SGNH/GDSL hydrolase family protein, partial [Rhodovulum sp. PH10]|uniref:SGNH/GDSL hydrolase family protein n=1 Tax=Rhodovulum sp. PH10 TaxID=1187851 RepID=UPI00068DC854
MRGAGGLALALLVAAEAMLLAVTLLVTAAPASAQLFDERFPFRNPFANPYERQQRYPQRQQQQNWNPFQPQQAEPQRPAPPPVDYSKAPAPKKPDTPPTTTVMVFGDSLADWLAYGLEVSFQESPEMGVVRKVKTWSGLIQRKVRANLQSEHPDWPAYIRETLATEHPDYVVMMIGLEDRRPIHETTRADPQQPAGQPAGQAASTNADDDDDDGGSGPRHEFRSEKWSELYIERIDATIAALKSAGVPVFWVGAPPVRGTRSMGDFGYLDDLYRSRAERAGIVYVDVWDGFVDENGRFTTSGPDVEGQIRRLRTPNGVHFTQSGARKLAHFVERELQRAMTARATPVSLPVEEPGKGPETAPATAPDTAAKPAEESPNGTARPLSGPVITLTAGPAITDPSDELLGGDPKKPAKDPKAAKDDDRKPAPLDAVAAKVLVAGEALPAPAGRADDFKWPRRDPAPVGKDPVVAFTTLPMTPMQPERQLVAEAAPEPPAAAAAPAKPAAA